MANIQTMKLSTESTQAGGECVRRKPARITSSRKDADAIRILNDNAKGSGQVITVTLDPSQAAKLFDPLPAAETALNPGDSVDWTVKAQIDGIVGVRFETDPDNCTGHDQDDIVISC